MPHSNSPLNLAEHRHDLRDVCVANEGSARSARACVPTGCTRDTLQRQLDGRPVCPPAPTGISFSQLVS